MIICFELEEASPAARLPDIPSVKKLKMTRGATYIHDFKCI